MKISNKTYQPLLTLTINAAEDIASFKFVTFTGEVADAGEKTLGVAEQKWVEGEVASIIVLGTAVVLCSEELEVGDALTSDLDGYAKKAGATDAINAIALEKVSSGDFLKCLLVH